MKQISCEIKRYMVHFLVKMHFKLRLQNSLLIWKEALILFDSISMCCFVRPSRILFLYDRTRYVVVVIRMIRKRHLTYSHAKPFLYFLLDKLSRNRWKLFSVQNTSTSYLHFFSFFGFMTSGRVTFHLFQFGATSWKLEENEGLKCIGFIKSSSKSFLVKALGLIERLAR